ncbi:MAG: hypothetical protein ACRD3W_05080, partial [Terriglobales bacterium]
FDLSGFETGVGPTLQGPNAQASFAASGTNPNLQVQAQVQFQQQQPQFNSQVQVQQQQQGPQNGAGVASTADQGDFGRTSNQTGFGPNGYGKNDSARTWNQKPVMQRVGTQGLAPVFGYGGGSSGLISPGGYMPPMLNIPGVGPIRIPSTVALPGGGVIQTNPGALINSITGP